MRVCVFQSVRACLCVCAFPDKKKTHCVQLSAEPSQLSHDRRVSVVRRKVQRCLALTVCLKRSIYFGTLRDDGRKEFRAPSSGRLPELQIDVPPLRARRGRVAAEAAAAEPRHKWHPVIGSRVGGLGDHSQGRDCQGGGRSIEHPSTG